MPACTDFVVNRVNKVICVFETTEGTGTFTVKSVVSIDDGATWGSRRQVFVPGGNNNNGVSQVLVFLDMVAHKNVAGVPFITTTSAGTLVASFMTDEDTSAHTCTFSS